MRKLYLSLIIFLSFCSHQLYSQISPYIVGGDDTNISEVPWQVLLEVNGGDACGGSIIAPDMILTAGHCVDENLIASDIKVFAGVSRRSQKSSGQVRNVVEIILHPNYHHNYNQHELENDIAILRLSSPLNLNNNVQVIDYSSCADVNYGWENPGIIATASGWGWLSTNGSQPDQLQSVDIPIIANSSLDLSKYWYPDAINDNTIAAGLNGSGICNGDSGGPLAVRDNFGRNILVGIASFRSKTGCANSSNPEIFTRVSSYFDWIFDYVAKVDGPSTVCSSGSNFTFQNLPANSTISWNKSSNLTNETVQGNPPSYSVEAVQGASGPGWIQAVISHPCGTSTIKKNIQVGPVSGTQLFVTGENAVCPNTLYTYTVTPHVEGNTYHWRFPNNWMLMYQTDNQIQLYTPQYNTPDAGILDVSITNDCGSSCIGPLNNRT